MCDKGITVNKKSIKNFNLPKTFRPLIGLISLITIAAFTTDSFLTITNLSNILLQASIVATLAAGMTLVLISAEIDLSVGTIMTLSSCTMGISMINMGFGIFVSILLALLIGSLIGFVNGFIITKGQIPSFIVTLGMRGIAQGIALTITAGYSLYGFPESFIYIGNGKWFGIPILAIIVLFVYLIIFVVLEYTKIGRYAFAVGGNEEAAKLAGINVAFCKIAIFTIMGLISGLSGVMLSARISSAHPGIGVGFELEAIAASVIGGTSLMGGEGNVIGTIIGALIMTTISNILNLLGISPFIQQIAVGVIIICAVLLDRLGKNNSLV